MSTALAPRAARCAAGALLALAAGPALADLTGLQVQVDYFLESLTVPQTAGAPVLVDTPAPGGVEYNPFTVLADVAPGGLVSADFSLGTIDFQPQRIVITLDAGQFLPCGSLCTFEGLRISNLSRANGWADFSITTAENAVQAQVSLSPGNEFLWIGLTSADLFWDSLSTRIVLDVVPTAPVPEPATWALWGLGLGAVAAWRRRRQPD